ncbi:MAG: Rpn family recombination-promoting nuclease/putative transposase, partial [bacterium]|nr:Rpn family recombination-promoting nuclease/putative transposase [bacterium]
MRTMKSKKEVQFPYDGLFRDFFDDKEVAASFMKEYVPGKINRHFDFDTLTISKDTFIDKELARHASDVLYQIEYKQKPLLVYLLFEHKSAQEKFAGFQVLKYEVKIW